MPLLRWRSRRFCARIPAYVGLDMEKPGLGARTESGGGEPSGGPGAVLLLVEDGGLRQAVRDSLASSPWTIRDVRGAALPERGYSSDLRAVVVGGGPNTVAEVLARMAWRLPVVVVGERYDRRLAIEAVQGGAGDWLSADQLDRLPAALRGEGMEPRSTVAAREAAASRIAARLVSPLATIGRLDEYCSGLVEMLGATAALVLVPDRGGDLGAAGACNPREGGGPAAVRISSAELATLRSGAAGGDALERLGLPKRGHLVRTELSSRGQSLGFQLVFRTEAPFDDAEISLCERLAGLACRSLERAETVVRLGRDDAIKTEFVRTVSHELRTPLNTVIGYSDLLVDEVFGPLDDEQRKILRRVGDRARGLLEVIAATLELPGVDGGRVSLETRPISVEALLAELEADAREWRVRDDLRYSWEIGRDLPIITTDAGKLRVLLKNLIANATKFTDRGGITVRARARDGGVEFSVEDTGIGIEGEAVHFVFDAFRQASAANARQYGGVGLGLYIVRRLVGMLGGRLRVESEVGVGSKFFVWIPAKAA